MLNILQHIITQNTQYFQPIFSFWVIEKNQLSTNRVSLRYYTYLYLSRKKTKKTLSTPIWALFLFLSIERICLKMVKKHQNENENSIRFFVNVIRRASENTHKNYNSLNDFSVVYPSFSPYILGGWKKGKMKNKNSI